VRKKGGSISNHIRLRKEAYYHTTKKVKEWTYHYWERGSILDLKIHSTPEVMKIKTEGVPHIKIKGGKSNYRST